MRTIHQAVKIIFFRCDYLNKKSYLSKKLEDKKDAGSKHLSSGCSVILIINGLLLFAGEGWVNGFFNR